MKPIQFASKQSYIYFVGIIITNTPTSFASSCPQRNRQLLYIYIMHIIYRYLQDAAHINLNIIL